MATKLFDQAKKNKADEFYTQLTDIEKELKHYKSQFKGKTVFCNCDDPYWSDFFYFFVAKFNEFGLNKLITTHYIDNEISLFSDVFPEKPYSLAITKTPKDLLSLDRPAMITHIIKENGGRNYLKGDGDFRSAESIELLKEADIVVTNPPFSLFREYVAQLIEYNKDFIIIGNSNAISYKEIFKLFKNNKIWIGPSIHSGDREFQVPNTYPLEAATFRVDENGRRFIRVKGVRWFTNMDFKARHDDLILYRNFNIDDYPKYENYDAINVDVTKEIPHDYFEAMGVPITFVDKYNPDQFEVIALGIVGSIDFSSERKMEILKNGQLTGKYTINAKGTLYRIYNPKKDTKPPAFKDVETGELYSSIYARIIIKRKK